MRSPGKDFWLNMNTDCSDESDDDEDYIPNGDVIEEREDTKGNSSRSPTSNRRALRSRNGNGVIVNGHTNNNPNRSNGSIANNTTSRYNFLTQSPMIGGPFNNPAPNHQLKKLDVPFQIFSEPFNRYHDDQEKELQSLVRLERRATKKCHEVNCELDKSRREIDTRKNNLKLINDQNKLIREQIESIHNLIIPICQQVSDELDDLTIGPFLAKFVKN
nr:12320_t:CDS:2 [Entrophospora candida]CAG8598715.1 15847_t:CDS:2 [Entrophospora candida]